MSSAPAAKQALLDILAARPALAAIAAEPSRRLRITWGAPTSEHEARRDLIWLGDIAFGQEWAALGARKRLEEYDLGVFMQSFKEGDDEKGTETRVWALFTEVTAAIRDNPSLNGTVIPRTVEIGDGEQVTQPLSDPEGWLARISFRLRCSAHLS